MPSITVKDIEITFETLEFLRDLNEDPDMDYCLNEVIDLVDKILNEGTW